MTDHTMYSPPRYPISPTQLCTDPYPSCKMPAAISKAAFPLLVRSREGQKMKGKRGRKPSQQGLDKGVENKIKRNKISKLLNHSRISK